MLHHGGLFRIESREGGYVYITSLDYLGFSLLLEPGQPISDMWDAYNTYVEIYNRLKEEKEKGRDPFQDFPIGRYPKKKE